LTGRVASAAATYFAVTFATGFGLGVIRTLLVAPLIGEVRAVLIETPIMLCVSWAACSTAMRLFGVAGVGSGATMGAIAFALLMVAEFMLSVALLGRSPAAHLRAFLTTAGAIGLAGQVAFGLLPPLLGGIRPARPAPPTAA